MLTNKELTFDEMAVRYGEVIAYGHLEQIERAAGIAPSGMTGLAPEIRLANALRVQDQMSAAA